MVERACDHGPVLAGACAKGTAAVPARVLERAQLAVVAPDEQNRDRADAVLMEVARMGDMIECARELPDPRPQTLLLEPGEVGRHVTRRRNVHRHCSLLARSTESSRLRRDG